MTIGKDGEPRLSAWIDNHARVCWMADSEPWLFEAQTIDRLDLNIDGNAHNAFYPKLRAIRAEAKATARSLTNLAVAVSAARWPRQPSPATPAEIY